MELACGFSVAFCLDLRCQLGGGRLALEQTFRVEAGSVGCRQDGPSLCRAFMASLRQHPEDHDSASNRGAKKLPKAKDKQLLVRRHVHPQNVWPSSPAPDVV